MSEIVLETERLVLRTWDEHYGRLLDKHCNTDAVMEHLGGKKLPDDHKELVDWLISQQSDYGFTYWVVETKDTQEFLGFCGLVRVDEPDSTVLGAVEIGYRFRSDVPRKGYATEAAQACLDRAFEDREEMDGLRVVSRTVEANTRSWKLMERIGMKRDPRLDYVAAGEEAKFIVFVRTYKD